MEEATIGTTAEGAVDTYLETQHCPTGREQPLTPGDLLRHLITDTLHHHYHLDLMDGQILHITYHGRQADSLSCH